MRTLFITFTYLRGNRGAIYASRTHINLFAELSEQMTLLYPYKQGMEPEGIDAEKMEVIGVVDQRSKVRKMVELCFGVQHRFGHVATEMINSGRFDVVVFDNSIASSRLTNTACKAGLKMITIHHNYQVQFLKDDCRGIARWPTIFWTARHERQAVRRSNLNITLTYQDVDLLRIHYSNSAHYAVLGVYDYARRSYLPVEERPRGSRYVITGGLASKQNEDSLIPWLNIYFPIIKSVDEEAVLTIAGRSPSERLIQEALAVGAKIIDSPKDMAPILQESDYYICPTDRGGGLKLRLLDGLKSGLPVLTHIVSARGYEQMASEGMVFAYHDEQSFRISLDNMRKSELKRKDIQEKYFSLYSFDNGVEVLRKILKENCLIEEPK